MSKFTSYDNLRDHRADEPIHHSGIDDLVGTYMCFGNINGRRDPYGRFSADSYHTRAENLISKLLQVLHEKKVIDIIDLGVIFDEPTLAETTGQ